MVIDAHDVGVIWVEGRLASWRNLTQWGDADQGKSVAAFAARLSGCFHDSRLRAAITNRDAAAAFRDEAQRIEHRHQLALVVFAHSRCATTQNYESVCLAPDLGNQRQELRVLLWSHTRNLEHTWPTSDFQCRLSQRVCRQGEHERQRGRDPFRSARGIGCHSQILQSGGLQSSSAEYLMTFTFMFAPCNIQYQGEQHQIR